MTRQQAVGVFKGITYVGVYGALLMPLVFLPIVIFPFVFSKLIFLQILIGLTFPAYVALAWMEPKYRPPKALLLYAVLAYFVALGLSVAFSADPMRSWWGNQERMNGLFTLLHFFAWLIMAVGLLKTWEGWRRLLNYEVVLSVIMALVALLQTVKKDLLLFPAGDRVGGLLDNPIYMGAYQIFNLSFLALLFIKTRSRTARLLYGIAALADIGAFIAAQSRGPLVGLAAVVGVSVLYLALYGKNKRAKIGVLLAGVLLFGAYGTAFAFRDAPFIANNGALNRLTNFSSSTGTRFIAWNIAWQGFLERPLTGWGLDAFYILFNLKYNPTSLEYGQYETWFDRAHNTVLDVLSMTGILGFVTFVGIFAALFISVARARKRGWIDLPMAAILTALPIGYFIQNLFVFDHPAAFSMSFLMYALVIAACRPGFMGATAAEGGRAAVPEDSAAATIPSRSAPRGAPWTAFAILQIIMLLAVWRWSVLPFQASAAVIESNRLRSVNPQVAWQSMKRAGSIPTPYIDEQTFMLSRDLIGYAMSGQLAQLPHGQEMYEHTKVLTERQNLDHPLNTNARYIYARLMHEVGFSLSDPAQKQAELAQAEREYRAAIETSPKRQQLYYSLARLYDMVGQPEQAYETMKSAVDFNQNIGESWWYLGLIQWTELGKTEEGMDSIIRAVTSKPAYVLRQVRDAVFVAQAAAARDRKDVLETLLPMLPTLGGGTAVLYLDIARAYEQVGLFEERNMLLNALEQADPTVAPQLEALRNGSASSIDESLKRAPAPAPSADAGTGLPTVVSSSGGITPVSGPRL